MTYTREFDPSAFWVRLLEHFIMGAFFAFVSHGFLTRKEFRGDLLDAHLMQVWDRYNPRHQTNIGKQRFLILRSYYTAVIVLTCG